ncbi:MAG: ABC-F family ATP-binding cassette domain-containing protein [Lachnospiraceae bacterium]|nr:ABC-F family ATP-binding cassette domain-containing protein [Lachnospiraceae bacterium]
MILQVTNGRVEFAGEVLFEHADFVIRNKKEKIALVGRNGCGKTTLLKVLSGQLQMTQHENDAPSVLSRTGNPTIGYLQQISFADEDLTVDEEIRKVFSRIIRMKKRLEELVERLENPGEDEAAHEALINEFTTLQETFQDLGGYYYEKEYDTMLRKFGFTAEDRNKKLSEFSGGQRTKLAFIKLLLGKPEVLLLDEPTNHLDIDAIEWLESYLQNYPYALVVVSHDRMFLDRIVDTVYEIEHRTIKRYAGNYTAFMKRKREDYEKQLQDYNRQQAEIKRLSDLAEKMKHHPTKVSMAHSKEKAIEHMDKIEAPETADTRVFHASFLPLHEPGKEILSVHDLTIGYAQDASLCTVSFDIRRGDRLGILGGNGLGKSTLLKTITGAIEPLSGNFRYGVNVEPGYFDQQMAQYSSDKTVLDDFWDAYPKLLQQEVRSALGAFLFTQEDVFKTVNMLSGGVKVPLAQAKIFQSRPNLLILDEPTNHMDMLGKEALESMLTKYTGTVIFVSHDRYFIKQVAGKVLEILPGEAKLYPFGYEDYLEKTGRLVQNVSGAMEETGRNASGSRGHAVMSTIGAGSEAGKSKQDDSTQSEVMSTKAQESYRAGKEQARQQKKLQKLEASITEAENNMQQLKDRLMDPALASDYVKLQEIQDEIDALEEEILSMMEEYDRIGS